MLVYPKFLRRIVLHTVTSDLQLCSVISQKILPITFYSRKLYSAQYKYTTTDKELLRKVETFKEFKTILLGYELEMYTDYKI